MFYFSNMGYDVYYHLLKTFESNITLVLGGKLNQIAYRGKINPKSKGDYVDFGYR